MLDLSPNAYELSEDVAAEPDLAAASRRLEGRVRRTPLLESEAINGVAGGRILVKAEALQWTGSFKYRGALNALRRLGEGALARGVVAASSGNHGQAVAAAARALGARATIVMPADAPTTKLRAVRSHGAKVVFYDRRRDDREDIAARLAAGRGAPLVRSSDDVDVIAGQGTVGLEILRHVAAEGLRLDMLLVPCAGGGLLAGCCLALESEAPATDIVAVEPEGYGDMALSLAAGRRLSLRPDKASICDALLLCTPGAMPFAIAKERGARGVTVSDEETAKAMAAAFEHLKLALEPGGAAALAAALSGRVDCRGKTVAVVGSGGNVSPQTFCRVLETWRDAS